MSAEEDLSLEAKAREWLDMAQTKWRLQTMQHRSRFNPKTGEYKQLPTRVRRFLNGTPVSMKAMVLSILKESAPYSCPVFDLETGDMKYVPTNTFIRKDGPELTSGGADATYTIVQDLKLLDETGDTFGMRDESSCAQVGETEWHWDEPDVVACPDGSQGVSYQIANVSRDRETDLFSYAVRKVQALTVHTTPVVSACTERTRATVETWDNVYGEPGAFRWDPVHGRSASLSVPEACNRSDGTLVRVSVNRNADCTYRVVVERVEAVTGIGMYYSQHDRYKSELGERTLNAFAPLPKQGVEYDHGLVTRYQSERNEDGTWTNDVGKTLERPVPESTVEERITPKGTTRTRVDTNVPSPAAGVSTEFGSWKTTKTPGGLYTNEYVEHVRRIVHDLGFVCTDTAFLKTHESQGTAGSVPSSAHVPPARNGLVTTWSYDTDAEGTVTKRVRTEQEHTVENAVRRRTWGWLGSTNGYVHRSVSSAAASAILASGDAGTSVEVRMTNGGLFDVEVQTFLRVAGLQLGFECQKTVYQHVHETAESESEMGEDAQDAGDGKTHRRSYSLDPSTGAITKRETVTTELEVPESRRTVRVTARGSTVRTVKANSPSKPEDASLPGQTTEFEVTPGGRFNVTVEETTPNPANLEEGCSKDLFSHTHTTAATRNDKADDDVQDTTDGSGEYIDRRQRLGDDGLWEVTDVTHTEKPVQNQRTDVRVTKAGLIKRTTDVQVNDTGRDPEAKISDIGKERTVEKTRGGKRNITTVEVTPIKEKTQESCSQDAFLHTHVKTKGVDSNSLNGGDVPEAKDGEYVEKDLVLNELGIWEERETTHKEIPQQPKTVNYQDAFGTRMVQFFANGEDKFNEKDFDAGALIKSVEQDMTRGKKYSARVTEEKPTEVDSGWLHFDKMTDKGLAVYYDFIVFRNAEMAQVKTWIKHIQNIVYSGGIGSYANHPSISISPNRFRLWDGAISLTTTFTPKTWAPGGNTSDDNWETDPPIEIRSVRFVPLSQTKLLKIVTTETHIRGGGVGRDKLKAVLAKGAMIKGSQFSYHPSGQSYSYDIITAILTKSEIIDLKPGGNTIWDGTDIKL